MGLKGRVLVFKGLCSAALLCSMGSHVRGYIVVSQE